MRQVQFSGVVVAVVAFVAVFTLAQKEVQAATAGKDKSASGAVRASSTGKSGGADVKEAPPAWVVSSTGTVARAEAGDIGAMEEIAYEYIGLARPSNTELTDDERMAMTQEAAKWMHRRAKVIVKTSEVQACAEKGDETATMEMARSYLFLATARAMEAKGEERKSMFRKGMGWLRRRAEKIVASGDADAIAKVVKEIKNIFAFPALGLALDLNEEEHGTVCREVEGLLRRRAQMIADRDGDVESVRKRAEAGDPAAQRNLGFRYSQGVDVEKNAKKAFEWTKKAAEKGDARAMFNLANDYANGEGVAKDKVKASSWYRKAAKALQALAEKGEKLDLRPLYDAGWELLGDESLHASDVGVMFLGIAAKCGDAEAMRGYGVLFASGETVKKDLDKGLFWLQKALLHGDEDAASWIELYYQGAYAQLMIKLYDRAETGDKEASDRFDKCMELYWKGIGAKGSRVCLIEGRALAGHAPSQAQLGLAYMLGRPVAQDMAKAVEWLRKAADQGEYRAMLWLGEAYEHGHGVAKDDWRAFDLWRRSHELGWDPATEKLQSLSDAYSKEAEKGNASAQFFMGVAHEYGYAGKTDAAKAVGWYRKAAVQGHPGAMFNLGDCYLKGTGVKKDVAEATKWFKHAASLGHERSAKMLEKLQKDSAR